MTNLMAFSSLAYFCYFVFLVTSYVIKQTLQSNNRQLAMTLEKTRQELRMAQRVIMDQKREIGELQFQVSTYKHLAGLGPEEIEIEVRERMEVSFFVN